MNKWWVVEEGELHAALTRAFQGEDVDIVLLEMIANSRSERVEDGD